MTEGEFSPGIGCLKLDLVIVNQIDPGFAQKRPRSCWIFPPEKARFAYPLRKVNNLHA
jgi:hypothetical protein